MRWILSAAVLLLLLVMANQWWPSPATGDQEAYAEAKEQPVTPAAYEPPTPAIDVEAAYRAIPHQRTAYDADLADMPATDSAYLLALFQLTDIGVSERVYLQNRLRQGQTPDPSTVNYPAILQSLRSLDTPEGLLPVETLIHEALQEHRNYLGEWAQDGNPAFFDPRAPLVQSSHKKLIAAYGLLKRRYGDLSAHNLKAFYDHLCALDFI